MKSGEIMGDRAVDDFLMRKGFRIIAKNFSNPDGGPQLGIISQLGNSVIGCDLRVSIGDGYVSKLDINRIKSMYVILSLYVNGKEVLRNKEKRVDVVDVSLDRKGRLISISHREDVSRGTL